MLLGNPIAHADGVCPSEPLMAPLALPHLRAALAQSRQALVVALGSSSTEGVRASNPGRSYPAVLQAALALALPDRHVAVINRGIGGQDASRELARLDSDVIAIRPQIVIWQVGANAALHKLDPPTFHDLVVEGVTRLRAAGIDVVLMDNQRAPRILATGMDGAIEQDLREVARATGASLFSRDRLMEAWRQSGFPYALFLSNDGLHHNDRGYRCVARALARAIAAGVGALPGAQAAAR